MTARLSPPLLALLLAVASASTALAQTRADCEREYRPQRGQEGKDVIWVPTEDGIVVRMLERANVTAADVVYDLGAGDGKIPIAAAQHFGATAVGIEYDADLARHAQCLVRAAGVHDRVTMLQGDIFETDFSAATVVTLYLLPALNLRLRPTLLAMAPGTRVVSYSFTMGDWEPDDTLDTDDGSAYFWVVPAEVSGEWTFEPAAEGGSDSEGAVEGEGVSATGAGGERFTVQLEQAFQRLRGSSGGETVVGRLRGEAVELVLGRAGDETRVAGTARGDRIEATVTRGARSSRYVAVRRRA